MTIREKIHALNNFCEGRSYGGRECDDCPLAKENHWTKRVGTLDCLDFEESPESELDEALRIIGVLGDDAVHHPSHYQGKNECIDVMIAMFGKEAVKHFCMCNAYKYRFRADKKNGEEDIKKAEWYETKLIELGGCDEG